jgi:hypothetical protein
MKLGRGRVPYIYGVIQSGLTTAIAAGVATYRHAGLSLEVVPDWGAAWLLSWFAMLPIVIGFSPWIQRAVAALCDGE